MSNDGAVEMGPAAGEADAEERAERLRERIYVTFTSLAVVLTFRGHADSLSAATAAAGLTISAVGTVLAAFTAELIAHTSVHGALPSRHELGRMATTASGALGAILLPLLLIAGAGLEFWSVPAALLLASFILIGTLGLVAWVGIRRTRLTVVQKILAATSLLILGLVVLGLKTLTH